MRRDMGIRWECLTRPDLLDDAMVEAMKRSGCVTVRIGLESGSKTILKHMQQRLDWTQSGARRRPSPSMASTGQLTCSWALRWKRRKPSRRPSPLVREINPSFLTLARFAPIPGTEMYDELAQRGLISPDTDWSMECNQRTRSHYVYGMTEDEFEQMMREVAAFVEAHNKANSASIGTRDSRLR